MEVIKVPKFVLEDIFNTLRIVKGYRMDEGKDETCLDRCVNRNLNQINKLLSNEEITGLGGTREVEYRGIPMFQLRTWNSWIDDSQWLSYIQDLR